MCFRKRILKRQSRLNSHAIIPIGSLLFKVWHIFLLSLLLLMLLLRLFHNHQVHHRPEWYTLNDTVLCKLLLEPIFPSPFPIMNLDQTRQVNIFLISFVHKPHTTFFCLVRYRPSVVFVSKIIIVFSFFVFLLSGKIFVSLARFYFGKL